MTRRLLIGEVARRVGVHPSTLRRWHQRGVIQPRRDLNGKRIFSSTDVARLRQLAGTADRPER
jgi:DNA-binding transcriptional MerR regulator